MGVEKVSRKNIIQDAHEELNNISTKLSNNKPLDSVEVQNALHALNTAALQLQIDTLNTRSITSHNSLLRLVDEIQKSSNFGNALGIYQMEFSGLLHRIEKIFREDQVAKKVNRVELDRLER